MEITRRPRARNGNGPHIFRWRAPARGGTFALMQIKHLVFLSAVSLASFSASAENSGGALPTDHVFAPTSFWYAQIPADAPLHTNSANFAAEFCRQIKAYYGCVGINTTSYASPVYVVEAGAPTVRVAVRDCQKMGWIDKKLE